MKKITVTLLSAIFVIPAIAQDKAVFKAYKPGYYQNTILKGISEFDEKKKPEKQYLRLKADIKKENFPTDPSNYEKIWHNTPISQGNTGTCWCFSTTSFYESEVKRITGKEVKLSEMYTVYWEYVERAKYFVQNRGDMTLGEGSETNAVARMIKQHGIVPLKDYTGLKDGQKIHTHAQMFSEIELYLAGVKKANAWNEDEVVKTVKSILNHHMGATPTNIKVDGKTYTPQSYLKDYLKIDMNQYVNLMSLMEKPYWKHVEYDVPDNWWNSDEYKNVPLDDYLSAIKGAIKKGYGISIGGDVSEAGFDSEAQVAIVPTFDIPSANIDENARQFRFSNNTTTDDHAMHMVGYQEVNGKTWFLIKDSGSGSRNCGKQCKEFGYYFFHEDYVKLKMMTITVHQDAVKDLVKKVQ